MSTLLLLSIFLLLPIILIIGGITGIYRASKLTGVKRVLYLLMAIIILIIGIVIAIFYFRLKGNFGWGGMLI